MRCIDELRKGDHIKLDSRLCKKGNRINKIIFEVEGLVCSEEDYLVKIKSCNFAFKVSHVEMIENYLNHPEYRVFNPEIMKMDRCYVIQEDSSLSTAFEISDNPDIIEESDFVKFRDSATLFGKDASSTVFKVIKVDKGIFETFVYLDGMRDAVSVYDIEKVDNWEDKGYTLMYEGRSFIECVRIDRDTFHPGRVFMMYIDNTGADMPDEDSFKMYVSASESLSRIRKRMDEQDDNNE